MSSPTSPPTPSSPAPFSPGKPKSLYVKDNDPVTIWRKAVRQILKVALYAALGRFCFGMLKRLLKLQVRPMQLLRAARDEVLSENPLKWATFIGGLATFKPILATLTQTAIVPDAVKTSVPKFHHVAATVSGLLAAFPALVFNTHTQTELGLYLLARSVHGLLLQEFFPRLPCQEVVNGFKHWDYLGMCFSGTMVLYALFFRPEAHSPEYNKFLVSCTMHDGRIFHSTGMMYSHILSPEILDVARQKGIQPPATGSDMQSLCRFYHPYTTSCNYHLLMWTLTHLKRFSMPLYVPLKTVTTLGFKPQKIMKHPKETILDILVSSVKSSLFLTLFCALPFRVICAHNQWQNRSITLLWTLVSLGCATPALLEPRSRRLDLLLFISMHAFRATINLGFLHGWYRRPNRTHVRWMVLSTMAFLLYQYECQPHVTHRNVKSTFRWVMGDSDASDQKEPTSSMIKQ